MCRAEKHELAAFLQVGHDVMDLVASKGSGPTDSFAAQAGAIVESDSATIAKSQTMYENPALRSELASGATSQLTPAMNMRNIRGRMEAFSSRMAAEEVPGWEVGGEAEEKATHPDPLVSLSRSFM